MIMDRQEINHDMAAIKDLGILDEINRTATRAYIKDTKSSHIQINKMAGNTRDINRRKGNICELCGGKYTTSNKVNHEKTDKHRHVVELNRLREENNQLKTQNAIANTKIDELETKVRTLKIARNELAKMMMLANQDNVRQV